MRCLKHIKWNRSDTIAVVSFGISILAIISSIAVPLWIDHSNFEEVIKVSVVDDRSSLYPYTALFNLDFETPCNSSVQISELAKWHQIRIINEGRREGYISEVLFSFNGDSLQAVPWVCKTFDASQDFLDPVQDVIFPLKLVPNRPVWIWILLPFPVSEAVSKSVFPATNRDALNPSSLSAGFKPLLRGLSDMAWDELRMEKQQIAKGAAYQEPSNQTLSVSFVGTNFFNGGVLDNVLCSRLLNRSSSNALSENVLSPSFEDYLLVVRTSRRDVLFHFPPSPHALTIWKRQDDEGSGGRK